MVCGQSLDLVQNEHPQVIIYHYIGDILITAETSSILNIALKATTTAGRAHHHRGENSTDVTMEIFGISDSLPDHSTSTATTKQKTTNAP